jgi:predicted MPP superfamily phosphohydrolase
MKPRAALVGLILLAAVGSPAAAGEGIAAGPYTIHAGATSATVVWLRSSPDGQRLRAEKLSLSGLEPGKVYDYRVGGATEGAGRFKTAPRRGQPFRFVVYGDTRSRHDVHARTVEAIAKTDPDFLVHTGDLVADGADTPQWSIFFATERELLRRSAFFTAIGNHEKSDPQFHEFFDAERTYSTFAWGDAFFAVLDSDLANAAKDKEAQDAYWTEQLRWVDAELAGAVSARFRFVVMHHPLLTAMKRRQAGTERLAGLFPILERRRVAAVFAGHDHNYQRHAKGAVQYVVTGGGGAPLYDTDAPIPGITQKTEKIEHYVMVSVSGKKARLDVRTLDGRLIEAVELKASKGQ